MSLYDVKTGKKLKDIYDITTGKKLSKVYQFTPTGYSLVYQAFKKLWETTPTTGQVANLQCDNAGNLYENVIGTGINKISTEDGSITGTISETSEIIGDLNIDYLNNVLTYVTSNEYWNKVALDTFSKSLYYQKGTTYNLTDSISSNYLINSYRSSIVVEDSGYYDLLDNSNTASKYPKNYSAHFGVSRPVSLMPLDGFGSNSSFALGTTLAYNSGTVFAYAPSTNTQYTTNNGSNLESSSKLQYSPIGYATKTVSSTSVVANFYLISNGSSVYLVEAYQYNGKTQFYYPYTYTPTNSLVCLVSDQGNYSNSISIQSPTAVSGDEPSESFTFYTVEQSNSGTTNKLTQVTWNPGVDTVGEPSGAGTFTSKILDSWDNYTAVKGVKKGNQLSVGTTEESTPWKFTTDNAVRVVAVDASGNVYAGTYGNSVYKLDSTGSQVWKFTADNIVRGVAVDTSGNVYAGTDGHSVYKLDSTGSQVWKFTADNIVRGVAVDTSGNVYAGTTGKSVYKLDSTGSQVWKFTIDGTVYSVAVDTDGNVYTGTDGHSVYKLDSTGSQVWKFTTDNLVWSVEVDTSGNVYAGTDGHSVYKLDSTGSQVWKFTTSVAVNSLAVDTDGNVYAGTDDYSVYKLNSTGSQVWKFVNDTSVLGVAVDASGNVYAGTAGSLVYKLTPAGSNTNKYYQSKVISYKV